MAEVISDACLDTLKIFPFLLLIYILIEVLEHRTSLTHNSKILQGRLAPLIASATGIIPQCGFSVMAAKLYDSKFIRTGTLMAVFIATSDEALIILLSDMSKAGCILPLILIKIIAAAGAGYLINFILSKEKLEEFVNEKATDVCGKNHRSESDLDIYFLSPFLHSLKIALYLFIVNSAFGAIVYFAGGDNIAALIAGGSFIQPVITAAVGLIPNCASSVILTEAFIKGGVSFGSFVGGLCANAGLGLMVLFKNVKQVKRNLFFLLTLFLIAVAVGLAVNGAVNLWDFITAG